MNMQSFYDLSLSNNTFVMIDLTISLLFGLSGVPYMQGTNISRFYERNVSFLSSVNCNYPLFSSLAALSD